MKLCIQNPVVMEFHSRMGTVNAATLNVGRLLYKGQLSHWGGWQLDRGPTNEYTERHNESSFTLLPLSPDTLRQTSHHNNQCPSLCIRERKATVHSIVLGEGQSQSQQRFSFTGLPWLHRAPQQGHTGTMFNPQSVSNAQTIAHNQVLLGMKMKNSHSTSFSHKTKALKRGLFKRQLLRCQLQFETEFCTACANSPSSDC